MKDSQEFKKRKIFEIKSVTQLANSYMLCKALGEIRTELNQEINNKGLESVPDLEGPITQELKDLFSEACVLVRFKPILVYLMKFSIEDMIAFNFSEDPSVTVTAITDSKHLSDRFGANFKNFAKISLYNHTVNVFREGIELAKTKGRSSGMVIPLIGSLLHDFGKCTAIREKIIGAAESRGHKAHAEVSSTYIKEILSLKIFEHFKETPLNTIELLSEAVKNHHASNKGHKTDPNVSFIIEADHNARKKEYRDLLKASI